MFKQEIDQKILEIQEPPPSHNTKALPVPLEEPKKKRGGKRARKQKEKMAITELRKSQNRMAFGEEEKEYGVDGESVGLGVIGSSTGKIRALQADTRGKVQLSKKQKLMLEKRSGNVSGFSSSLAFTPVQGLELSNPETQAQKVKEANERWFSK